MGEYVFGISTEQCKIKPDSREAKAAIETMEVPECVAELVKSLRICAKSADHIDECEFPDCSMHKDRDSMCLKHLLNKAADMIEKLSRKDKE